MPCCPHQTSHRRSFCRWLHVWSLHQRSGSLSWAASWDRRLCHAHQGRDDDQASNILQRPLLHPGHGWHGVWPPGRRLPTPSYPLALLSHCRDFPLCGAGGHDARVVLRTRSPDIKGPSKGAKGLGTIPPGETSFLLHEQLLFKVDDFFQVLGMTTGICIMLLIALYEHDLKAALGGGAHIH